MQEALLLRAEQRPPAQTPFQGAWALRARGTGTQTAVTLGWRLAGHFWKATQDCHHKEDT